MIQLTEIIKRNGNHDISYQLYISNSHSPPLSLCLGCLQSVVMDFGCLGVLKHKKLKSSRNKVHFFNSLMNYCLSLM